MSATSCVEMAAGRVSVVTHVIPVPQVTTPPTSAEKNKFSLQLVALGTVRILVGLIDVGFGISLLPSDTLVKMTGVFIWAPVSNIAAGSLAVAAGTFLEHCMVRATLIVNFVATVASAGAAVIHTLGAVDVPYYGVHYGYQINYTQVSAVLASFSSLGFVVSIYISVISGRASCTRHSIDQPLFITNQPHEAVLQTSVPTVTSEVPSRHEGPSTLESSYESMRLQEYNTIIM